MNHRITKLPNGKFIAEIEVPHPVPRMDIMGGVSREITRWVAVFDSGTVERGGLFFGRAQKPTETEARELLRKYLDKFYGAVLPAEVET